MDPRYSRSRYRSRAQQSKPYAICHGAPPWQIAGLATDLIGYSLWLAPILFGTVTFVVSVAGHQIGRTAAQFIPRIRRDLMTGIAFVAVAAFVAAGMGG